MAEFSADQIWNNLLKEIARQAFEAGMDFSEYLEEHGLGRAKGNYRAPSFGEWWETFAEQHRTDG